MEHLKTLKTLTMPKKTPLMMPATLALALALAQPLAPSLLI
jgi:hypothetical protein